LRVKRAALGIDAIRTIADAAKARLALDVRGPERSLFDRRPSRESALCKMRPGTKANGLKWSRLMPVMVGGMAATISATPKFNPTSYAASFPSAKRTAALGGSAAVAAKIKQ
jgi:hypothetical protein